MIGCLRHAGDDRVDRSPSLAGQALALDDDHAPAFAETSPSLSHRRGNCFVTAATVPTTRKERQGGEFQKMQVREIILAAADDGGVDDAVADHLQGAVKRDQGCGAAAETDSWAP